MLIGYARILKSDRYVYHMLGMLKQVGCQRVYQDVVRGSNIPKAGLQTALSSVNKGDMFVVPKLSHLGMSLKQLIEFVTHLETQHIGFWSVQEAIDTTKPDEDGTMKVFKALVDYQREVTRVKRNTAIEHGRKRGRRKLLSAPQIEVARAMLEEQGNTMQDIADYLHVSKPTLYRYLKGQQETGT